ncbi:MAG: glutamine synthetase family protein [Myxococcaceae bacterium]|nr:glutamine synthetase family protein [Myxococcaceae bacterium]MCI0671966.1 glutamine synthetase family protein [Myxococcaceae bacterium]
MMTRGSKRLARRSTPLRTARGERVRRRTVGTTVEREPAGVDALERWLHEKGATKAKVGGFDVDGVWRGKYISVEKLLSAVGGGLGFCDVIFGWDVADELLDNAEVTGWHSGYPDLQARVDVSSGRIIPWEPDTAAFLLDFVDGKGGPFEPSPRQLLQRVSRMARDMGYLPRFGAEFEYFLFRETPQSLRDKGFQRLTHLSPGMFGYSWLRSSAHAELVHAIVDGCRAFGIDVEGMHTETGPGVYETALRYDELERAADKAALFKTAVKEICARHGVLACFMAKVDARLPGCSGHLHQSLWDVEGRRNLFHDARAEGGRSTPMRHYLGGQLTLMPELTALCWPTVNSYKRAVENTWAPTRATWGVENRTCAVRVIPGGPKGTRVEYRLPGADMNPYVAMAASLAAGLWGIRHRVEPPRPTSGNGYATEAPPLPRTLKDAVALLRRSRVARELLGEGFVDHYCRTREWEVRQHERAVTPWELERYFELA